jgi:DNA-binding transcriptional ArsR family regulator
MVVADRTRMRILQVLADGERAVGSLTTEFRIPQPTVSHHLAWLRQVGLVAPRRQGKHVFYSLGVAAHCDAGGVLTLAAEDATVIIAPRSCPALPHAGLPAPTTTRDRRLFQAR